MKYKDRRQGGPDQPVELMDFRPTLVPSILVNKLWADVGTSILWKRYPHLPALERMQPDRRQWYAEKVERLFVLSPQSDLGGDLDYLEHLEWPHLQSLELDADWKRHGQSLRRMLHSQLEHLEVSGSQTGDSTYIADTLLPTLFASCENLRSIHISPDTIDARNPIHNQTLSNLLDSKQSIREICIMNANFFGKDLLFSRLSQRSSLEALEIDLDPGLQLLPFLQENSTPSTLFSSLQRLHVKCYPEIAVALPAHLSHLEQLSMEIARIPNQPAHSTDITILNDILEKLVRCPRLRLVKVNIGQLATNFPFINSLPKLDGASLVRLATACSNLKDVTLLASEPAAIDASNISSAQFEQFCQLVPGLTHLSLKLHPGTAIVLEESALRSLGKYCHHLEVLRLKIALQLPNLPSLEDIASASLHCGGFRGEDSFHHGSDKNQHGGGYVEIKAFATQAPVSSKPLFSNLTHFALARPQTVLSISADTYAASSMSQSSSIVDPWIEEELVRTWAQSLLLHFPHLDILEAWSDWTGHDNDSLNYFLPLQEPLASTWEFLSGIEQDLWDDGPDTTSHDVEQWDDDFEEGISFESRGSGDWERASLINEFPEERSVVDGGYLDAYDDEPEDMITPIDERHECFTHLDSKFTAAYPYKTDMHTHANDSVHQLTNDLQQATLLPRKEG